MDIYTILWILLGVFILICGVIAIIVQLKVVKKIRWIKVEATVCELEQRKKRIGNTSQYNYYEVPTYQYTVNGQEYTNCLFEHYRVGSLSVGTKMELYVEEKNPSRARAEEDASYTLVPALTLCEFGLGTILSRIIGWWMLIVAVVACILTVIFSPN